MTFAKATPEQRRRWNATAKANARARRQQEAEEAQAKRAAHVPVNARSYGEPWDSIIRADADAAVPLPELKRTRREAG